MKKPILMLLKILTISIISLSLPALGFPGGGIAAPLVGEVLIDYSGSLETGEDGKQVAFTVSLSEAPDSSVLVSFSSSDESEGVVDQTMLTFSPMNWQTPQTLLVIGVDDDTIDGDQAYTLVIGEVFSLDPDYSDLDPEDFALTNVDDDYVGVVVEPASPIILREGTEVAFTLRLNSRPEATVSFNLTSGDPASGTLSQDAVSIEPADWNTPVQVTITGVEDAIFNVTKHFPVVIGVLASSDPLYNGFDPDDLVVRKLDNEYRIFSTTTYNHFAVTTQMVFEDYFESDRGWEIIAESRYSSEYITETLHLRHEVGNYNVRAVAPFAAEGMPVGYRVSTDASIAGGAHPETKLGLLFDWQDVTRFYRFYVDAGSNQYYVQKFNSTYQTIASGALPPGTDYFESHHLAVERDGAAIRVYFDNALLVELNDVTYTGGRAGLIVVAPISMPSGMVAEGVFDNFTIQHTGYNFQNLFSSVTALNAWELIATGSYTIDIAGGALVAQQLSQAESVRAIAPLPEISYPERYVIESRFTLIAGSEAESKVGILFDWVDPTSHYRYILLPGTLQYAIQKLDGSYQSLVSGSLPVGFDPGMPHELRLEREGEVIRAYLDGRLLTVYVKTDALTGKCGLTVIAPSSLESGEFAGAEFDYLEVKPLY